MTFTLNCESHTEIGIVQCYWLLQDRRRWDSDLIAARHCETVTEDEILPYFGLGENVTATFS